MNIPNPRIERRILGYLASAPSNAGYLRGTINPRKIMEICDASLLKDEQVNSTQELENLLMTMENRELIRRHQDLIYGIADNGFLQFKLSLADFENIDEKKKIFDKIIDSGKAKKEVKNAVKKILESLKGKTGQDVTDIILNSIRQNPTEYWNELLRILEEYGKI